MKQGYNIYVKLGFCFLTLFDLRPLKVGLNVRDPFFGTPCMTSPRLVNTKYEYYQLVPGLKSTQECVQVPKEVCGTSRSDWRPLIGPDQLSYWALIGGALLCWCHAMP